MISPQNNESNSRSSEDSRITLVQQNSLNAVYGKARNLRGTKKVDKKKELHRKQLFHTMREENEEDEQSSILAKKSGKSQERLSESSGNYF